MADDEAAGGLEEARRKVEQASAALVAAHAEIYRQHLRIMDLRKSLGLAEGRIAPLRLAMSEADERLRTAVHELVAVEVDSSDRDASSGGSGEGR